MMPACHSADVSHPEFQQVDWENWEARQHATLLFVVRNGRVLLIHKKRGLGAGKINAPGGKIDAGETPMDGAIREVREEVGVTPTHVRAAGELCFQFTDGHSILCHVFRAADCLGDPEETEEARPFWASVDAIPYESMWDDDYLWLPLLLSGTRFRGRVLFQGETMLAHEIIANAHI